MVEKVKYRSQVLRTDILLEPNLKSMKLLAADSFLTTLHKLGLCSEFQAVRCYNKCRRKIFPPQFMDGW